MRARILAVVALVAGAGLALALRPAEAQQGQACGVGRPCPNGFSCSNLAGNSLTGWGRCNRDRPRGRGEGCIPGVMPCGPGLNCGGVPLTCHAPGNVGEGCDIGRPCRDGLNCEAGSQVCRGPGREGESCHLTRPCAAGLNCEAGTQVCRGPGREGDSCHLTRPCGSGLNCEAGSQTCRAPGREGESCHLTRPCGDGLNCEAGTQVCRRPGRVGETCHLTRPCGNGLSCQAIGAQGLFKCAQDELDLNSSRPCGFLYVQAVSEIARRAGTAFTWGAGGSGTAGIAAGNIETGVAYGPNGEFGCYATVCVGVATPGFTVAAYAGAGIYNSWSDVAGLAFNINESVVASRALTAVIDIGPGFNISQWFNGNWQLIGATAGFSMNLGFSVVPIVSLGASACCTVVAERGATINSLGAGIRNCATQAQQLVENLAGRRPISQNQVAQNQQNQNQNPNQNQNRPPISTPGNAPGQVFGDLQIGSNVGGNLTATEPPFGGRPVQWYGFRCSPGMSFRVDVTAAWDNVAYVVGPNGQQVAYNDDANGTNNAQVDYTCASGAPHWIGVGAFGAQTTGAYTVRVSGGGGQPQPVPVGNAPGMLVGELQIGSNIGGNLPANASPYGGRPTVWYTFRCSPGMAFQVNVQSVFDNVAFVTDPSGNQVAFSDDVNGTNAQATYSCPNGAPHFIGVGAYSQGNSGAFTVQVSGGGGQPQPQPQPPQPQPVGTSPGVLMGELSIGSSTSGNLPNNMPLFGGRPAVWYSLRCSPGMSFQVDVTSTWDNVAFVADGNGQQVAFNDDANGTNARVTYTCPSGAPVFIGVGAYSAANTGQYTVQVSGGGGQPQPQPQPQPPPPAANAPGVVIGDAPIGTNVLHNLPANVPPYGGRPVVWYRFSCSPGQSFQASVTSTWDNVLYVVENGAQVAYNDDASGTNAVLPWQCRGGGTVFIGVGAYSAANTGSYTFVVSGGGGQSQPQPPQQQPQPQPQPPASQPSAPPAGLNIVGSISFGATVGGSVAASSPQIAGKPTVLYRFQCQPRLSIVVNVTSTWDNVAMILDGSGNQVAYNDDGNGRNALIAWTCPSSAGYLIGVGAYSSADVGSFTLAVTAGGGPQPFNQGRPSRPEEQANARVTFKMCKVPAAALAAARCTADGVCPVGAPADSASRLRRLWTAVFGDD